MANPNAFWSVVEGHVKNRVVLVADNSPYLRTIIRTILLQLGVKATREVGDGFEAIDAICTMDPWAMILDWGIRGMDAREVVRVVRTSGVVPDSKLPIIGVSDPLMRSRVVEAKGLGIDHLVLRPVSPKLLQQRLFPTVLKLAQASSESRATASPADAPGLLTQERAAELLHVSPSWLRKARKSGEGPPHLRVENKIRYREKSLVEWIKSLEKMQTSQRH